MIPVREEQRHVRGKPEGWLHRRRDAGPTMAAIGGQEGVLAGI